MRPILVSCLLVLLSGCGDSSVEKVAANACVAEINQRLTGKTFEFDESTLSSSAKLENGATDIWHLSTPIVFDRGLSTEFTQNVNCKARVANGSASVLSLEFIWAMKDLKLDGSAGS